MQEALELYLSFAPSNICVLALSGLALLLISADGTPYWRS